MVRVIDRPKEPPKLDDDDDDFGNAFPTERPTTPVGEVPDERPTVSPPFDVEEYAKASDSKVRTVRSNPVPEVSEASTKPPPVPDFDLSDELPQVFGAPAAPRAPAPPRGTGPMRPAQITLTDEDELETARLQSVLLPSDRPPRREREERDSSGSAPEVTLEAIEDASPSTVAYPPEYERDPFAHLGDAAPSASAPASGGASPLREMRDRFSLGDYTGALESAEGILHDDPGHTEAFSCAEECRSKLLQMYTARIGPLDRVPVVMVPREQLRWLSIDHRAGFLLSHIDGVSSLEMILDVSGMPLLDALKILCELAQQRVISFR